MTSEGRKRQGFAGMDPNKHREIASKGGKSNPDEKRTFSRDHSLAATAGRKGGLAKRGFSKKATDA